jgi:HD-like signal output (HDOD) protein
MTPESLVRDIDQLFSFPEAALRINELIDQPTTTLDELADVILTDPALSARLLRLVNSAYYARQVPVDTVSKAVQMIGFSALRELALATASVGFFSGLPAERINMEQFWFDGIACGMAARELDQRLGYGGGEQLFLAGLLHSVGKLVFFSRFPEEYRQVLDRIDRDDLAHPVAEEAIFGFNYATLGGALLQNWHFPELIWQAVAHHLNPEAAGCFRRQAELIQAAGMIAGLIHANHFDSTGAAGERERPPPPDSETNVILHRSQNANQTLQSVAIQLGLEQEKTANIPLDISLRIIEVFDVLVPGASIG